MLSGFFSRRNSKRRQSVKRMYSTVFSQGTVQTADDSDETHHPSRRAALGCMEIALHGNVFDRKFQDFMAQSA
jgi:hypothetical protein